MDKKTVGLIGAVAGLATIGSAQAAITPAPDPAPALQASSYADLLAPVADAAALLKADDATRWRAPAPAPGDVRDAQYYYYGPYYSPYYYYPYNYYYPRPYYYHHHHHHHRYYRRPYRHHHHHAAVRGVSGVNDAAG
jgi:hypothetical protein